MVRFIPLTERIYWLVGVRFIILMIDVVATLPNTEDKELIRDVPLDGKDSIRMSAVVAHLKKLGYPLDLECGNLLVSYFNPDEDMYEFIPQEVLSSEEISRKVLTGPLKN